MSKRVAPYGEWVSPITTDLFLQGSRMLQEMNITSEGVSWLETRPTEAGRSVLMHRTKDGKTKEVCPSDWSIRTRVHEYGGGAFRATEDGFFGVNQTDQRIYALSEAPKAITAEGARFADMQFDVQRNRLIAVREQHPSDGSQVINDLVSIRLEDGQIDVLASGNDFYTSPRVSPDGQSLAWLSWDHPYMPWDSTILSVASFDASGTLEDIKTIAGGLEESIFQPEWSPDGVLHFISDRSGFWNLYRCDDEVRALKAMDAEFGRANWVFGMSSYGFADADTIVCTYFDGRLWQLARLNPQTGDWRPIQTSFTTIRQVKVTEKKVYFIGGKPTETEALMMLDLKSGQSTVIRESSTLDLPRDAISVAEAIRFETTGGQEAHGYFYAPCNQQYRAPEAARPPLILISHGGPTSAASPQLSIAIQYWTSRGFAILDVNYGGSTGYGRAYRERLKGQWGIVDVDDCAAGALALVKRGLVDGNRLAIRGGSAGGFTTLASLAFRDVFHAGSSYFGVSDLTMLAEETHKFESRYLDGLIGPYPEAEALYKARSPMSGIDQLSCPAIFLQGSEDRVVPPNQAEVMVDALREKGIPVAYLLFEGEDHGFRDAKNIKSALEGELYFFGQIFGFTPADSIGSITIENLKT